MATLRWSRGDLMRAAVLAVAFGGVDALSSLTTGPGSGVAGIWIPGGVGLAGLLVWGLRLWPALAVGGLAAAPAYGVLGPATVPVVLANVLAIVVAAWVIGLLHADPRLGRLTDVMRFALASCVGAIPFGALGVACLLVFGDGEAGSTPEVVSLWVLSTVTGFVVVGGAITTIALRLRDAMATRRAVEFAGLTVATAVLAWITFTLGDGAALIVLLLAASLLAGRGGPRGAAVASLVMLGFAAGAVMSGTGPFGGDSVGTRSLTYQTAVLVLGIGFQAIGAIGSGEPGAAPATPTRSLAIGLLIGGGLSLGISEAVVAPEIVKLAESVQITLLSMTFALVVVIGVLAGTGARGHAAALRATTPRVRVLAVIAGLAVLGAEETFLVSLASTPATAAVVLSSLAPVMLLLLAIVRGRLRPSVPLLLCVLVVLVGLAVMIPNGILLGEDPSSGVWLALASSACTSVALLSLAACRPHMSSGPVLVVAFASATAGALALCLAEGIVPGDIVFGSQEVMGGVLYLAVAGALIPMVVATWAVSLLGATRVAAFEVLAPPMAIIAALAWGEAVIGPWQAAGMALIIVGLVLGLRSHRQAHGIPQP